MSEWERASSLEPRVSSPITITITITMTITNYEHEIRFPISDVRRVTTEDAEDTEKFIYH